MTAESFLRTSSSAERRRTIAKIKRLKTGVWERGSDSTRSILRGFLIPMGVSAFQTLASMQWVKSSDKCSVVAPLVADLSNSLDVEILAHKPLFRESGGGGDSGLRSRALSAAVHQLPNCPLPGAARRAVMAPGGEGLATRDDSIGPSEPPLRKLRPGRS